VNTAKPRKTATARKATRSREVKAIRAVPAGFVRVRRRFFDFIVPGDVFSTGYL